MTTGWVQVFDESFQRVPVSRLHEMYAAGFRVLAGYAGGGSKSKWLTVAEMDAWFALGDDTGIAPLFEIVGDEPITNPTSGDDHARAARAAWRARGVPDHVSISPAVDLNVSLTQARNQLTTYFGHWKAADTVKAIPYVEADAGAVLMAAGVSAGTFVSAAFGWDPAGVLYTPANAPAHVIWTQEHNARKLAGGDVDVGHIRVTAPVWWKSTGEDMALTQDDIDKVAAAVVAKLKADPSYVDATWRIDAMANSKVKFGAGSQKDQVVPLTAAIDAIPTTAIPAGPIGPADLAAIANAVNDDAAKRLDS